MGGPKEKWGTPKKFFPALRTGNGPPTFNLLPTPLAREMFWKQNVGLHKEISHTELISLGLVDSISHPMMLPEQQLKLGEMTVCSN